jgi:hypothetical protein
MSVYGICLSGGKKGKKTEIKMDVYDVYKFERGGYYVRGESSKCPHVLNRIVDEETALKLAGGKKIPIWKGDPATKKKREAVKKKKKERKEIKKIKEKEKKQKEKEKAKKAKESKKKSKKR